MSSGVGERDPEQTVSGPQVSAAPPPVTAEPSPGHGAEPGAARGGRLRLSSTHVFAVLLLLAIIFRDQLADLANSSARLQTAATVFLAVFVQAVPFLALGVLVSGAVAAFVSAGVLERVLPRNKAAAVCVAGAAGAALPGCECGAVPVAKRLQDRGAPAAAALAFMLSAPAINPVVLTATAVAFPGKPELVAARFVGSLATAWLVGWIWARFGRREWTAIRRNVHDHSGGSRWQTFTEAARHDLIQSAAFLVFGAAAAAAMHVFVPASVLESLHNNMWLAILALAVLAVVLALCSEADAFVAASMSALPLLPRLVFLVVGPAVDVKLMAMQWGAFGRAFVLRFAPLTFVVAVACGTLAGWIFLGWN